LGVPGASPADAAEGTGSGGGWRLSTTSPRAAASAPAYVGNGYVGTRVPAATETHVAGVYGDVPDPITGGTQHQGAVNLPGWTQLDASTGGDRLDATTGDGYEQTLDL